MQRSSFGPGLLVTAAFIGPGTVTACTIAGASFGYALVWALVFATLATIILQDMAARLGGVTGGGLGDALMQGVTAPGAKFIVAGLIIVALGIGNSAYQAGNLTGAALGSEAILGVEGPNRQLTIAILAAIAAAFLMTGSYKLLERVLIVLVVIMSLAFMASLIVTRPDLGGIVRGLVPQFPEGSVFTAMALIGTTIVPYNLFLHAAAARARWGAEGASSVSAARKDTTVAIGTGGLISIFILVTAAASLFRSGLEVRSGADLALAIEPAFGPFARYLVGTGLLAAGLSSAMTAPMAAAFVGCELARQPSHGVLFRVVALGVLAMGTGISLAGFNPLSIILVAQVANGILLPLLAVFLLVAMNQKRLLGVHVNSPLENFLGGIVLVISFSLGVRLILRAVGVWP